MSLKPSLWNILFGYGNSFSRTGWVRRFGIFPLMLMAIAGRGQGMGDALDATDLVWTNGCTAWQSQWEVQTNITHDGIDAATCYLYVVPSTAWIETSITGPVAVNFWWKTSTASGSDPFEFYVGGQLQTSISGETPWQRRSFLVPAGPQVLQWRYVQNPSSGGGGQSRVWLDEVSLSAPEGPQVEIRADNAAVSASDLLSLAATVSGTEPLHMRWRLNGDDILGATNSSLMITNAQAANGGDYTLEVANPLGVVTSKVVAVTVSPAGPTFTAQPASQSNILGSALSLRSAAKGSEPLNYQWYQEGEPLAGETNWGLSITNLELFHAGDYYVVVANQAGSATSQVARLTVILEPVFTRQPGSQGAAPGATVSFAAAVRASGNPSWQWYFNGREIPGATSNRLVVTDVQSDKLGGYWAVVTNSFGNTASAVAVLGSSPVVVWGDSSAGQMEVPPTATNVVALAGGDFHSLALRRDGGVVTWGGEAFGIRMGVTNVSPFATNVVGIAAGSYHGLALRDDGSVVDWGYILGGKGAVIPLEATNVVALALGSGAQHALALRGDGTVIDWGASRSGLTNIPPAATNVIAVAAGAHHCAALRADGTIVCWGVDAADKYWTSIKASNFVAVASGWYHVVGLRADGTLMQWLTGPDYDQGRVPPDALDIVTIACGGNHGLALRRDGKLLAWGSNSDGRADVPEWATNLVGMAGLYKSSMGFVGEGPPHFTTHPMSRSAVAGDLHQVVGEAVGVQPLSYQWLRNGEPVAGADQRWLVITNIQADDGLYSLVASNAFGAATSRVATVAVSPSPLRRVEVPAGVPAMLGSVSSMTATAFGSEPISYQWQHNGTNVDDSASVLGTHTPTLVFNGVQSSHYGEYRVIVTNAYSALTSSVVRLHYPSPESALELAIDSLRATYKWSIETSGRGWDWQSNVTHDGVDAARSGNSGLDGSSAGFFTYATGPGAVSFWWRVSSQTNGDFLQFLIDSEEQTRISGQTEWEQRCFAIPLGSHVLRWRYIKDSSLSEGEDAGWIDEMNFGYATVPKVTVWAQPAVLPIGSSFTCLASVAGTEPFSYQWQHNGNDLPGQTNSLLALTDVELANAGAYCVRVTNPAGSTSSAKALLMVVPAGVTTHPWAVFSSEGELQILWSLGKLEAADSLNGPWTQLPHAVSPFRIPTTAGSRFFRVALPWHP